MNGLRVFGICRDIDAITRAEQKLVPVDVHDQIALDQDTYLIKGVAMLLEV